MRQKGVAIAKSMAISIAQAHKNLTEAGHKKVSEATTSGKTETRHIS